MYSSSCRPCYTKINGKMPTDYTLSTKPGTFEFQSSIVQRTLEKKRDREDGGHSVVELITQLITQHNSNSLFAIIVMSCAVLQVVSLRTLSATYNASW
jgi:hypothetical protein